MARARIEDNGRLEFRCPGCEELHAVPITGGPRPEPEKGWSFNGRFDAPTLSPSILRRTPTAETDRICHSYVHDGRIQFLSDSTHALSGQVAELPALGDEEE